MVTGETANFILLLLIYLIFTFSLSKDLKGTQLTYVFNPPLIAKSHKNPQKRRRFLHSATGVGKFIYRCFDQCGPPQRTQPVSALPAWPPLSTWARLPLPSFLHHARQDGPKKEDSSNKYHKLDPTPSLLVILNRLTAITAVSLVISWEAVARICASLCRANVVFHHWFTHGGRWPPINTQSHITGSDVTN